MRYLLFVSIISVCCSCSVPYKNLKPLTADVNCILKFKPHFTTSLYNTNVNVIGKHLSGLLIVKAMPDSSMRLVFTSETGLTFFDFEYSRDGSFKVHHIIKQMNRRAVIRTLQKDFELVLMRNVNAAKASARQDAQYRYTIIPQGKEWDYYITDPACSQLERIEKTSKRKIKVSVIMKDYHNGVPDTIGITHHNFNFNIGLKLLER